MAAWVLPVALTAASIGSNLLSEGRANRKEKIASRKRRRFFDTQISPLLNEMNDTEMPEMDSLYSAEMQMPLLQMQNQMESLSRSSQSTLGQSGFQSSGFLDRDTQIQSDNITASFENQKFGVQRGLIDLQSQLESMTNQNRLQAKELEYRYKYG